MKRIVLTIVILCFTQQFANAQTEKEKTSDEVKKLLLKNDFSEMVMETFSFKPRKEFSDFLNQKAKYKKISDVAKSDLEDDLAIDSNEVAETKKKGERVKHKYEAQFNYSTEALSNNFGVWRTASFYFQRKSADKKILWGQYRLSQRRNFRDREFIAGIYKPLSNKWAFTAEGMYSPTKLFVGKYSAMGEVEKIIKGGWVAHFGGRYTSYTTVKARTGYALVEKYWGNNRLANTLYVTNLSNAGTAPSYRIQYNRYYGERVNTFGTAVSFGREHENLGPTVGILRANTWSVSGSVRHWINDNFGISADVLLHRQGNIYYRRGLNFGARYRF